MMYDREMTVLDLPLWETVWLGNSIRQYAVAAIYFVGLFLVFKAIQKLLVLRLTAITQRTRTDIDDAFIRIVQTVRPSFYFVLAIYFSVRSLAFPLGAMRVFRALFIALLVYQVVAAVQVLVDYLFHRREVRTEDQGTQSILRFTNQMIRIVIWAIGILFILSNIGVNVTSLIAGLGVGGIAVALAAQNVLGDLFSSLAIYLDRPFGVGDFIVVNDVEGTVRHIGIKTTRVKSLSGEEIIIPNRELTSDRIKNYKRMEERRVSFDIDVTYDASLDKLRAIPDILKAIVESVPNTRFGRTHFYRVAPTSLTFRVVFFVTQGDFKVYMDARQEINYKIMESFDQEQIKLALPIGTIQFKK